MKGFTLAALASAVLLCGCAGPSGVSTGQDSVVDRSDAPLGSYIKRKTPGSGPNNTSTLDKQALENERTMNNGAINVPQR